MKAGEHHEENCCREEVDDHRACRQINFRSWGSSCNRAGREAWLRRLTVVTPSSCSMTQAQESCRTSQPSQPGQKPGRGWGASSNGARITGSP